MSQKMVDTIMGYVPLMVGLIIALIAIKIILVIISHILKRDKRMDPMVYKFIYNSVKVILLVILLIAVLAKLGVPTSSMVAVVSVGGAAVAIALRDTLSDILGGLTIIISKPFKQGDLVVIDAHTGFVMNIELLATTLKSFTNELIRIPNGVVTKSVVVNRSHGDKHRMDINVTVSYDTNIAKAREVLLTLGQNTPAVLKDPAPAVFVAEASGSGIELVANYWTDREDYLTITKEIRESVVDNFRSADISIP